MNTQPPSKRLRTGGQMLLVHSIFHTIQGEGPFCGKPAVFIRLAGCNLQCSGCDTEYTKGAGTMDILGIFKAIQIAADGRQTNLVVITGGEPFRQNLSPLVNQLHINGVVVQIETNGSMAPQGGFIRNPHVVCSPKTSKLNPKMFPLITAYKYVIDYLDFNSEDGLPTRALGHQASPQLARPHDGFMGEVYVQPMDMSMVHPEREDGVDVDWHNNRNTQMCVESAMRNNYCLQLQIHKIIGVE